MKGPQTAVKRNCPNVFPGICGKNEPHPAFNALWLALSIAVLTYRRKKRNDQRQSRLRALIFLFLPKLNREEQCWNLQFHETVNSIIQTNANEFLKRACSIVLWRRSISIALSRVPGSFA